MTNPVRPTATEFDVGEWRIDRNSLSANRGGESRPIEPKAFSVLCFLHERPGELVTIDALMDALWAGSVVTPNAVSRTIAQLRKVLDDDARNPRYIETVARTGYRYIGHAGTAAGRRTHVARPYIALGVAIVLVVLGSVWLLSLRDAAPASIAVLPFQNLTGDANADYIGDGVAEEIIHSLTSNPAFRVAAQRQSFRFRDPSTDLAEIARELDVEYIVAGSVRRNGPNLRLTAQLVDPQRGENLHAIAREVGVLELFDGQDAVSRAITTTLLDATGWPADGTESAAIKQPAAAAYDLYLRGRHIWHRRGGEPLQPAIDLFREAVEIDPDFARGWGALATAYLTYPSYSPRGYATWHLAEDAAQKALQLNPDIAEPYGVLATFAYVRFEWMKSEELFLAGIRRDSRSATANFWYGEFLETVGKPSESARYISRALELDPTYRPPQVALAFAYLNFGDVTVASQLFEELWDTGFRTAVSWTGNFLVANLAGDSARARRWVASAPVDDAQKDLLHRFVDATLDGTSDPQLVTDLTEYFWDRPDYPISIWLISRLGGYDEVFALTNARLDRNRLLEVRPFWAPGIEIRQQPEFLQLLDRIGLIKYWELSGWGDYCSLNDGAIDCDAAITAPDALAAILSESTRP